MNARNTNIRPLEMGCAVGSQVHLRKQALAAPDGSAIDFVRLAEQGRSAKSLKGELEACVKRCNEAGGDPLNADLLVATLLQSAADFPDSGPNRNLIDALTEKNGWQPYRSIVCFLMYHLQEENLVLL